MAYQEDNSHAERGDCTPIRYLIISETVKGDPESITPKVGMVQDDVMKNTTVMLNMSAISRHDSVS